MIRIEKVHGGRGAKLLSDCLKETFFLRWTLAERLMGALFLKTEF